MKILTEMIPDNMMWWDQPLLLRELLLRELQDTGWIILLENTVAEDLYKGPNRWPHKFRY